jgi:hypothetical protein
MFFKSKNHPIVSCSYAVTTGTYVGEILVYVEESGNDYLFISLPKNINRSIPKDKFDLGMSQNILDVVEKIPSKIYNLLHKQFVFNKKNGK